MRGHAVEFYGTSHAHGKRGHGTQTCYFHLGKPPAAAVYWKDFFAYLFAELPVTALQIFPRGFASCRFIL